MMLLKLRGSCQINTLHTPKPTRTQARFWENCAFGCSYQWDINWLGLHPTNNQGPLCWCSDEGAQRGLQPKYPIKTPPCPTTPGDNPYSSQHDPDRSFQALLQDQVLHRQGHQRAEGAPPALALNPHHPHPARTDQGTLPPTFFTEKHQVVQAPPGSDTKMLLLNADFWQTSSSPTQTPSSQCCKGEKGGLVRGLLPLLQGLGLTKKHQQLGERSWDPLGP